ncbi:hypothetical protein PQC65_gp090 [Aeromonas phage pAEv1810]|uniref:hypothetical protein n=1 Tax=Aeromonas phage pAEv1810 TaxID=2908744 RepID=UPI002329030D|nr:hypothetical protein PQC65_gp090 [Aeromonas phage pAEv1810]UIS25028.1 hypothetical protein pAEv1810_90 [Aeromonas phage pAEv1810]
MKKFYCFTAGQLVPSWVVDFVSENPESEFNNRKGKITFASSCLGVKEETGNIKLLRLNDKNGDQDHDYITVSNMDNIVVGGIGNGRGIHIASRSYQKDFGKGLHYSHSIVNGKEVLIQLKGFEDVAIQGSK